MRSVKTVGVASVIAAAALVLSGCGGSGDPSERKSPLDEYMNTLYGTDMSPDELQERAEAENKERENLIAACMQKEGFEYIPSENNGAVYISNDEENPFEPDKKEWVEEYGYGVFNWPGRDDPIPEGQEYEDPNQEYLESLSESEQMAYYEALNGPGPTEEELNDDGSWETTAENSGCWGKAFFDNPTNNVWQDKQFEDIIERINTFYQGQSDDPGFAEVEAAWAACMAEQGESFKAQGDAVNSIYDAQNEYWEEVNNSGDMPEEDSPEMTKIQEREIELALKDLECRESTDYTNKRLDVQFKLEEQFIKENKADLDALKAAVEQAQSKDDK